MEIHILGAPWKIEERYVKEDPNLQEYDGYTDWTSHLIVVCRERDGNLENVDKLIRKVKRHEIIHAMLFECGLAEYSDWAQNEEMIDWFARMAPLMCKLMCKANAWEPNFELAPGTVGVNCLGKQASLLTTGEADSSTAKDRILRGAQNNSRNDSGEEQKSAEVMLHELGYYKSADEGEAVKRVYIRGETSRGYNERICFFKNKYVTKSEKSVVGNGYIRSDLNFKEIQACAQWIKEWDEE